MRFLGPLVLTLFAAFQVQPVAAQGLPPAIRAILEKQKGGQELSEGEQAQLEDWESQQEARLEALEKSFTEQKPSARPKPRPKPQAFPATAPGREAYLGLVRQVARRYGPQIGAARTTIDERLVAAKYPEAGADLGAVLLMAGGGSASVYACSQAAQKAPGDYLAANNLGWALCGMGDTVEGISVLRYAHALRPKVSLALINLGWAHHNAGQTGAAKGFFQKAMEVDPQDPAPHLGLGLIAQVEERYEEMISQLWQALTKRHSVAGAEAFSVGRDQGAGAPRPLVQERGSGGLEVSEAPEPQKSSLQETLAELDGRLKDLSQRHRQVSEAFAQRNRESARGANAGELRRSFDREMFLLSDIARMTLGSGSPCDKAWKKAQGIYAELTRVNEQHAQTAIRDQQRMMALAKELEACGHNEICIAQVKHRMEKLAYEMCLRTRDILEADYAAHHRAWRQAWEAFREGARDYYAFTDPVLARIYDPLLNELQNLWRERMVLHTQRGLTALGLSISEISEARRKLKCVEPQPLSPPKKAQAPKSRKKEPECPLERPLVLPLVVAKIELDCTKAKLEFGELLLGSIQRDFVKKETTFGFGVGLDSHSRAAAMEAKMMVEMTVGGDGSLKDVVVSHSTALRGGPLQVESTVRASIMGGPEGGYSADVKWDASGAVNE